MDENVRVDLGLSTAGMTSAQMYLFNGPGRYMVINLDPVPRTQVVRGYVTLAHGTWRPDVIVLRDRDGVPQVRDVSEVGWQLEVQ